MQGIDSIARPDPAEYGGYFQLYIGQVPGQDALPVLEAQRAQIEEWGARYGAERETYRYEAGKWSVRELVGHVIDTERVFMGRALWFARAGACRLPGMEQDDWVAASRASERPLGQLLEEALAVRASTLAFVRGLERAALDARGVASDNPLSVRAAVWIVAGHLVHHARVLDERYGPAR